MMPQFIHLNLHTDYSIVDGLMTFEPLLQKLQAEGMPSAAITDQMNFFGLVKFYQACLKSGLKPILGASVLIQDVQNASIAYQAILLCCNPIGYRHLSELLSQGYLQGQSSGKPVLQAAWIQQKSEGLIMLSGAQHGDVGMALLQGDKLEAEKRLQTWQAFFPQRYYVEIQRIGAPREEAYIRAVVSLAIAHQVPVVATNAVRFLTPEDFTAHEARVAIGQGFVLNDPKRPRLYTSQQYLRSAAEMQTLFADLPAALQNSVEIAKRCNVSLALGKVFLPDFPVPVGTTIAGYLTHQAQAGLEVRLQKHRSAQSEIYWERLHRELDLIIKIGFAGYFLIVADFIRWAKSQDIPVGPGRGSGAGSLVAYALQITDIDPIEHDLLFERFLNPERVSMPDFDIDFCVEGRDRVIHYVMSKYGHEAVSQIITYGTMAAKAVVRDVGRVLGHPYGFVDKIAKLIPFELGITLEKALSQEVQLKALYDTEEEVTALIDLAKKLEGAVRNVGTHAGGVVIAPSKLTDFVPVYCEPGEQALVSQFDKDDVEAIGLVKFDFLGLRTLTIIHAAVKEINRRLASSGKKIEISDIPLDDEQTYALLQACHTNGVFQLESRGIKDLIKRLQPDRFDDLVSLVALFRPGPLQSGMVDDFIERRHQRVAIEYQHPWLEPILRSTYGVIVYQEQVMQIAQVMAGYSLGSADLLRRAMGKKKPEEMAKQRLTFINGAVERGVENALASHIFDLMEKFAGYGFNKSHSVAYALIAYQTAWLKAHYPSEFMAAFLSSVMENTDKVVVMFHDCQTLGITVLPPDINRSDYFFSVSEKGEVHYGLGAIKGIGQGAIEAILAERKSGGNFSDLFSFCQRIDLSKVNRRVLEALIKSGALDSFGQERSVLWVSLNAAVQQAEQISRREASGQRDLFSDLMEAEEVPYLAASPWSKSERLTHEKSVLGLFLTGHPLEDYRQELSSFKMTKIQDFDQISRMTASGGRAPVTLMGLITHLKTRETRKGDRMAFLTLEDESGQLELAVFSDRYQQYRAILQVDGFLIVQGESSLDLYTGNYRLNANHLYDLTSWRNQCAQAVLLKIRSDRFEDPDFINGLKTAMEPYKKGNCPIWIDYQRSDTVVRLELGEAWRLLPSEEAILALETFLGVGSVSVLYHAM